MNQVFDDFANSLKEKYKSDISIYAKREKIERIHGEHILLVEDYFHFTSPKYIVSENNNYLSHAEPYKSRFVFKTHINNIEYVFILSSMKLEAYEQFTKAILNDILNFKESFR